MCAVFRIADGSTHFWLSQAIYCKNSLTVPDGWNEDSTGAPVPFENPRAGVPNNFVWVQVSQEFAVEADQNAFLHLFMGRSGPHYRADVIANPANQSSPVAGWTLAQWNAEMDQGRVVRIPFTGAGDACEISHTDHRPGPGNSKWYLFQMAPDLYPPDSLSSDWHVCFFAYIDDNKDSGTDYSVQGNERFSQMNCIVDPSAKRDGIRRRVVFGSRGTDNRVMGVHVTTEGAAAEGAEITLRFVEPASAARRIAFPDGVVPAPQIPAEVTRSRTVKGQEHAVLRDAPQAWGVEPAGSKVRLIADNAGFRLPVEEGELIQLEVFVKPGPRGKDLKVHLLEFTRDGLVPGGVTLDIGGR